MINFSGDDSAIISNVSLIERFIVLFIDSSSKGEDKRWSAVNKYKLNELANIGK